MNFPNESEGIVFRQPTNFAERQSAARRCRETLKLSLPCVVDTIDNAVDNLYAGWPERIFVIDRDGTIAYAGKQGPWGFKPEEAELTLRRLLKVKRAEIK
jgi:hypothetical protein